MGKSTILARLVAVCAVAAVAGGVLAGVPVSAQAPDAPSSSVATPRTSVASPAAVRGNGVTPRGDVVWTCLRIKVAGVSAGGRASVTVTGTKANKLYSKVINRSKTLRVAPGVYRVTAARVAATGGTDVPKVETKMLRVRKNRCTDFTVRYQFVPSGPIALPQTITFTQPADTAVNAGPVALSATATSGLTVTFASTTTGVCTVSGASVTLVVAGVCTINADQVGNSTFAAAPQVQRSFAVTPPPGTVGATGPGGGKIFYVDMSRSEDSQRFEAAPDGWNVGVDPSAEWGCYQTYIPGADGLGIGTGENNTAAIVDSATGCPTPDIAARLADGYSNAGQTDWFLPSQDELNQLCKYAWGYTSAGAAIPDGQSVAPAQQGELCSVLPPNVLQEPGFSAGTYWSSSQDPPTLENPDNPANNALCQIFNDAFQCPDVKMDSGPLVRPIRAF